jgi:hypothetical protein
LQTGVFTLQNAAKDYGMEISPEKPETMAFLGQDRVTCKIILGNNCLQVKNFKYLDCEIFYENSKDSQQKLAKFAQILGISNSTLNILWPRNLEEQNDIIQKLFLFFCIEAKFGPSDNRIKTTDINRD